MGGRPCGLDGALGGNLSFEVLRCGDLHLVITEVVPVGGGTDQKSSCAVHHLSEGLRRVRSLVLLVYLFCSCYFCYFIYMQHHVRWYAFFSFLNTAFAARKFLTRCLRPLVSIMFHHALNNGMKLRKTRCLPPRHQRAFSSASHPR